MASCGLSHFIFTFILKKYFLLQSSQEIGFERFGSTLKAVEPAASNGGLTEVHTCCLTLMETRGRLLPRSQVGSSCFCHSWAPCPYAEETKPSWARHPGLGHTRPHVGHRCAWPWWGGEGMFLLPGRLGPWGGASASLTCEDWRRWALPQHPIDATCHT